MARQYRLGPLRRAVNAVMTPLVKVGAGPGYTYLLTTMGRKSGQPRTTPVNIIDPHIDAKKDDPVERFVAEAHQHPVFRLTPDAEQ